MSSLNLTAAFFVTQIVILLVVYIGLVLLSSGDKRLTESALLGHVGRTTTTFPLTFAGFALFTIGLLAFSEDLLGFSRPVFGGIYFPSIERSDAFLMVFLIDLIGAALLILLTGGSKDSPFSAVLFVLPFLSIFLRESPQRFFTYTAIAAALFLLGLSQLFFSFRTQRNPQYLRAFGFVTLGCLALSTVVGYATRP